MPFHVHVTGEAHEEAIAAYNYYETVLAGLGDRFLTELGNVYTKLASTPQYYSILNEDGSRTLRDVTVKGFPYVVIFEIERADVWVYAVHNTNRELWLPE